MAEVCTIRMHWQVVAVNIVTFGIMFGAFSTASVHVQVPIFVKLAEYSSSVLLSDVRIKPAVQVALEEISCRVKEYVYANFTLKCTYSYMYVNSIPYVHVNVTLYMWSCFVLKNKW